MTDSPYPKLRLKPKADTRAIRFGHPWAWSDDLVLDRRSRALAPGTLVVLEDNDRRILGMGVATPSARIGFRMLDRDPQTQIDQTWFAAKIKAALDARIALYADPFYRLIHAEGDALPGLIVDRFGDCLVMQPNARWLEDRLDMLADALMTVTGCTTLIKNGMSRARQAEDLPQDITVLQGTPPNAPIQVPMNGAVYMADVMGGQKTGLFYDQRPNHAFAAQAASGGAHVLDVFSHVGGFGLACLAQGAAMVTAVDGSAVALDLAQAGAETMGRAACFTPRQGDAFDQMETLATQGAKFDIVIADPPAFAPAKPTLEKGLRAYERVARLAAGLVADRGMLILCSCSHAADLTKFRAACLRGMGRARRDPRLVYTGFAGPDHPQHPALSETGYLKALAFRML